MSPEIESRTDWRRLVVALTAGSVVVSAVSMVASSNPGNQAVVESIPSVEPTAVTPWRVPIGISPSPITLPSKLHRKADLLPNPTQLPVILRTDVASQPHKSVTYSQASTKLAKWVERAPGIMELAKHFPDKPIRDPKSQLRRISLLDAATPVTALDLANFQVNTRYQHAFDDQIGGARIVMRGLVAHMSVDHFAGGVTEYISFMRLHHRRSLYFIDDHAQAYQLFPSSSVFPATAKGANSFFHGFETDAYDVLNLSIAQMKTQKLLSAYALNQAGLQPGPETLLSHTVVDLLFSNATYDNDSAQFRSYHGHAPYLDKIDPAQELVTAMQDDVKQILK